MKLVAATRVLNEADIIEAFVRHTAHTVDHHLLIDNGSVDGTVEILRALQHEGIPLTVLQTRSCSFAEEQSLTLMYRQAVQAHQADWIVFLDADEFIDDRALVRPLRDHLAESQHAVLKVCLRDYHLTQDDPQDLIVPCRMPFCTPTTDNMKVIVRGNLLHRGLVIRPGSHAAVFPDGTECPSAPEPALTYAHYPTRSPYQWLSKSVVGWAKVVATGPAMVSTGHAVHYRDPYEFLRTDPKLILRNPVLMQPQPQTDITKDPIAYRGGDLKFTAPTDYPMRAVQVVMQYLHDLAVRHGEILEHVNALCEVVHRGEAEVRSLYPE